jgi:peptide/nickel transport system substrate-binding protein
VFKKTRWLLIANAVLVALLLVTACGTPAPAPTPPAAGTPGEQPTTAPAATTTVAPTQAPAEPKIIRIATAQACPAISIEVSGGMGPCDIQVAQIYEGLTFHAHDGSVQPSLGTSWEMLDDTTWQFKLREGVTFHNGEAFTADDVKYSFDIALDEERAWPIRGNIVLIDEVEVVDDYTVNFHTSAPWPDLPWFVSDVYIMPQEYTDQVGLDGLIDAPVGTGPFEFVDFVADDYLQLKAYDGWWDGRVALDGVLWKQIPEPATRVAALQAGEIDIAVQVPLDLIPVVEDEPGVHMDYAAEELTLQFFLSCLPESGSVLADNVKLRQALDYAIDKEALWQGLMGGRGALSGQQLSPTVFGYNPAIEQTPYDPEMAKQLLAEAGYPNGLTVSMACPVGKYFVDKDACIAAQGMLEAVGVNVDLTVAELAVFVEYLTNPVSEVDMIYVGWYSYGNPAQAMQWFSSTQPWARWHNDEYDAEFLIAKTSMDEETRKEAYWRMAEILKEETPSIFLLQQPAPYGISDRVEGFKPHPAQQIILTEADLVE